MKSNRIVSNIILFLFITLLSITPILVAADSECEGLCNPLGSNDMSLIDLWVRILQLMLGAVGLFGVMMFIYGGFVMLTSAGNPEKVKKAKDTLVWAVLGLATIFISGTVVRYIFDNFQF